MGFLGSVGGFILGFFLGQILAMLAFGSGRHMYVAAHPELKVWVGGAILAVAFVGAYAGYRLAT